MEQVNAMRAVLVAGALAAAVICAAFGIWSAAIILLVGVGAHGLLWRHLRRSAPQPSQDRPS
jgi:hypothetical protein